MPLYNQATNLSGGGNAPSVSYYAGIKAPKAPDITLPKATGGFNIDLSRIGDAMIAAKESETRLGLAAVEMEENLRNAERDRQFKLDLLEKEQAYEDARQDKKLAMDWQIAKLNNSTELEKLKYTKSKAVKDERNARLEEVLESDEELLNAWRDFKHDPVKYGDNFDIVKNQAISRAVNATGGTFAHGYDYLTKKGYGGKPYSIESAIEKQKKIDEEAYNVSKTGAQTAFPELYAQDPNEAMNNWTNLNETIGKVKYWQNYYESHQGEPELQSIAMKQIQGSAENLVISLALDDVKAVMNNIRDTEDPGAMLLQMKNHSIATISQATGLSPSKVGGIVDEVYRQSNIENTVKEITTTQEGTTNWQKNAWTTAVNSGRRELLENGSTYLQAYMLVGEIPGFTQLLAQDKMDIATVVSAELLGQVSPNAPENGGGYTYTYRGQSTTFTAEQLKDLSNKAGINFTDQSQVALWAGGQLFKGQGLAGLINKDKITPSAAVEVIDKTIDHATGVVDGNYDKLTNKDFTQLDKNIKLNCSPEGVCPVESMLENIKNLEDGPRKEMLLTKGNSIQARRRMAYLNDEKTMAEFDSNFNYVKNRENITGEQLATLLGQDYNANPKLWNSLKLKDTKVTYQVEGDKVKLGVWQNGWLKVGGTELEKSMNYVTDFMTNNGISVDEQLGYIKTFIPDAIELSQADNSWFNKAITVIQDNTLGLAGKLETLAMSKATEKWNEEDVQALEINRVEPATDNPYSEEAYPLVENKDGTVSGVKNIIKEFDGVHYIIPTMWKGEEHTENEAIERFLKTHRHFGGYKTANDALNAEEVMHKYHELNKPVLTKADFENLGNAIGKINEETIKKILRTGFELSSAKNVDEFLDSLPDSLPEALIRINNTAINLSNAAISGTEKFIENLQDTASAIKNGVIKTINDIKEYAYSPSRFK